MEVKIGKEKKFKLCDDKDKSWHEIGHEHDCFFDGWLVSYKWTNDGIMFRLECWEEAIERYIEVKR